MVVSILAAAWQPEDGKWDGEVLKALLESFARDVSTPVEHKIEDAFQLADSGTPVLEALASTGVINDLTYEAIRIAIVNNQLSEFFSCWQQQPLVRTELDSSEQTFTSKLFRLALMSWILLNVLTFIMLFIMPEFQKMFSEFGLEMTPTTYWLIFVSDLFVKFWFISAFAVLVFASFFFRDTSFLAWWRRWFPNAWTATVLGKKDQKRLMTAWKLRPVALPGNQSVDDEEQKRLSSALAMNKSETAALALTNNHQFKDWLLRKMITKKRAKRNRIRDFWATIILGFGHCFLGLVVLLLGVSVFGTLLAIVEGLSGARP